MKKLYFFVFCVVIAALLFSCSLIIDPSQSGSVTFQFEPPQEEISALYNIEDAYAVVVSIEDSSGTEVYSEESLLVYRFGDSYISETIALAVGTYNLTEFLVVDGVGDVIYAIGNEFGPAEHGRCLPTAEYGIGSLKGLLIMAGPGIKKDCRLERTVSLLDIVPTLCHLLELPIPKDAEGGIIYQALEDPDSKMKELKRLRKNYRRVMDMLDKRRALTHT